MGGITTKQLFTREPETPKTQLIIQVTQDEKAALSRMADQFNTTMTDIVLRALRMYADKHLHDMTDTAELARHLDKEENGGQSTGKVIRRGRRSA